MELTEILNGVITLAAALVSAFLIPWMKEKYSTQQLERLILWADIAVAAAEQLYSDVDGEEKRQFVLDFLAGRGYRVDEDAVEKALEAAVLRLHAALKGERT